MKKIFANKEDLLHTFKNIDITKRGDFIYLAEYSVNNDTLVNIYIFIKNCDSIHLEKSIINFEPHNINKFNTSKESMLNYLKLCIEKMENCNVESVSSDFSNLGVTMILYLREIILFSTSKTKIKLQMCIG